MARSENYCLQWRDYQTHVTELFGQLLASDSLVDTTLIVEGKTIRAHRVILSACSTFFQEMLSSAASAEPATMVLCEENHEDVRSVVEFAYRGELSIPADRVESVLRLARDLRIAGLMEVGSHEEETTQLEAEAVTDVDEADDGEPAPALEELEAEPVEESVNEPLEEPVSAKDEAYDKAERARRGPAKRNYNLSSLHTALDDLRGGRGLAETAAARNVPRSTLYFRARALGVPLAVRAERSPHTLDAAVDAVQQGLSLAAASRRFDVPKTVLWRRVRRQGHSRTPSQRRMYAVEQREAAVKALEAGENLTQVADRFGVPKSTLFREKTRLVASGRLPWTALRRRDASADGHRQRRLAEAVDACRRRRMSQAAAAIAFRVPKTTIWRHMQMTASLETAVQDDYSLVQVDGETSANDQYNLLKDAAERGDFSLDPGRGESTEGHFSLIPVDQGGGCYLDGKPEETYSLVEVEEECVEVDGEQEDFSLVEVDPTAYIHQSDGSAVIVITGEGVVQTSS